MTDEIDDEFATIDHAVRTVLAFEKKASESNAR